MLARMLDHFGRKHIVSISVYSNNSNLVWHGLHVLVPAEPKETHLLAGGQQEAGHAHAGAKADSGHLALHVLHGVVNGQAGHQLQHAACQMGGGTSVRLLLRQKIGEWWFHPPTTVQL